MGSIRTPRKCTTLSFHFGVLFMIFMLLNWFGNTEANAGFKITKEPPPNVTLYVRSNLQLTWQFKEVEKNILRKAKWGTMKNKLGSWDKIIYVYDPKANPPQILVNPASKKEFKDRVQFDESTYTFELRNLSLANTGFYGCQFDIGLNFPFVIRSVFVKVVDVELLLPPAGKTTTSLVSWMDHKIKLMCSFRTEGPINITWEVVLPNGTRTRPLGQEKKGPDHSTLSVVTSREQDFQPYICTGSSPSTTVTHKIPVKRLYRPSAPRKVKASISHFKEVKLEWEEPKADGGSPIQQYVVDERRVGEKKWVTVTTERFTIAYVPIIARQDTEYRVRAKNVVGKGKPSNIILVKASKTGRGIDVERIKNGGTSSSTTDKQTQAVYNPRSTAITTSQSAWWILTTLMLVLYMWF